MVQSRVRCEDLHFTDSEERQPEGQAGRRTPARRSSFTRSCLLRVNAAPAHPRHPLICHLKTPNIKEKSATFAELSSFSERSFTFPTRARCPHERGTQTGASGAELLSGQEYKKLYLYSQVYPELHKHEAKCCREEARALSRP